MSHQRKKTDSAFAVETDVKQTAAENRFYRRVLYTGPHSQLAVMSIPPEGETGEQNEPDTDKIIFIVRGKAKSVLNKRTRAAGKQEVIFVPAENLHNLTNAGRHHLKLLVVYSPPLYDASTVHKTAEDALRARGNKFAYAWEE